MNNRIRSDRGAILVITALVITLLFVIVAIVIDLGATRSDRRGAQLASDNAVSAAAFSLSDTGDGEVACEEALDYLEATLEVTFSSSPNPPNEPCSKVASCDPTATSDVTVKRVADPYTVFIHHPVVNSSSLMDKTSTIGASSIGAGDDGDPCQRVGVVVTTSGDDYFGGIAGSTGRESTIWAVARANDAESVKRPLNLLVLDRTGCPTLESNGGADVEVLSYVDTDGTLQPGVAGNDSDGSKCKKNEATIQVKGGPGSLTAFGPCGTDPDAGDCETGIIQTWADVDSGTCAAGTPGPDWPACDEGTGSISPDVLKMLPERLTRAPLDHRYNCKASYTVGEHPWVAAQPIGPCTDDVSDPNDFGATVDTDWVDELYEYVDDVQADPAAFAPAPDSVHVINDCSPAAVEYPNLLVPAANTWYVDCDDFRVNGSVVFRSGNVIFRGDVTVSSGSLTVNRCLATLDSCEAETDWDQWENFDEWRSSERGTWAYIGGQLTNNSSAGVTFNNTAVFLGEDGLVDQAGGAGLVWTAPDDEGVPGSAGPFEDLALWSEGTDTHEFQGGGVTDFEGVFFTGRAKTLFSGSANMTLDKAQFVAYRLSFSGNNVFKMQPDADRSIRFDRPAGYTLIR